MKNFKFGFTLAEVLITLAIIGVVAALTLPTLIQNYQEKETVTRVKQAHAQLTSAFKMAAAKNGPLPFMSYKEDDEASSKIINVILPFLNISEVCGIEDVDNKCFSGTSYYLSGQEMSVGYATETNHYKFRLHNGTSISMRAGISSQKDEKGVPFTSAIMVDTNGPKGPNTLGKDLFHFFWSSNTEYLYPCGWEQLEEHLSGNCSLESYGYDCTAWVLEKGNMDYLHQK